MNDLVYDEAMLDALVEWDGISSTAELLDDHDHYINEDFTTVDAFAPAQVDLYTMFPHVDCEATGKTVALVAATPTVVLPEVIPCTCINGELPVLEASAHVVEVIGSTLYLRDIVPIVTVGSADTGV